MPLAAKIFEVKPEIPLEEIADKLRDYRIVDERVEEGEEFELITEVRDLDLREDRLEGVFSRDKIILIPQHGKTVPIIKTVEARIRGGSGLKAVRAKLTLHSPSAQVIT